MLVVLENLCREANPDIYKQEKRNRAPGHCDLLLLSRLRGTSSTLPEPGFSLDLSYFAALEVVSYGMRIFERESLKKGQ